MISLEGYAAAKKEDFYLANDLAIVSDLDEFCQDVSSRLEAWYCRMPSCSDDPEHRRRLCAMDHKQSVCPGKCSST